MSFAHSFFKNLSDNYKTLFNQAKIDGDVTIIVGCEKDAKTNSNDNIFKAHSLILSTQSPWFKTILSDNKKKDEENIVIDLPNISSSTFNILLKYLYYGEINISLLSGKDIFELLIAMNELKINGMSDFLQDILLISHENCEIFHSKCLDINNTLVVIRIAGTRKVIGGYNPLAWKKCVEWKPITHNFGASGFGSFGPPSSTSKSSDFGAQPLFNGIFGSSTTQSSNLSNITKTTQIASTVGFGTPSSTTQNKRKSLTGFTGFGTSPFTTQSSNSSQITSTTKPSVGSGTLSSTTQSSNSSQITSTTKPSVGSGTLSSTTQSSNSSQITSTTKPSVGSGTLSSTTQSSNSSQITSTSVGLSSLSQITSTTKSSVGLGSPFSSTQSSSISLVTTQSSFSSLQITTQSARTNVNTSPRLVRKIRKMREISYVSISDSTLSQSNKVISLPQISDIGRFPLVTTEQQNLDFLSCKESFIFSFNYDDNDVNVNEIKFTKSDVEDSNYGIGLLLSNSTGPRFGNEGNNVILIEY
ncbi:21683_t:CDS:2 [Rhizophagus irregularis]|nr:21683_t:CDS:2 [Rhizophagus irregularis]